MINKKLYKRTQNIFNKHWELVKDLNKKYQGLVCYLKHNDRKHIIEEVYLDMDKRECDYKDFIKDKTDLFVVDDHKGRIAACAGIVIDELI